MDILEFGNKNGKKLILIHGFESPYQIWEDYIKHFGNIYHIIVPILVGHNPKKKEEFISFEQNAKEIENYIISNYGKDIYAIYGMSMGGVLAAHLWQNNKLKINNLIMESSPLVSYNGFVTKFLINQYLSITHKSQNRDRKVIDMATKSIITPDKLDELLEVLDNITDTTIKNYITQIGNYKLPTNIDTTNTNIYYYHGTKINEMFAKKTAKYIRKAYPNSNIVCFKGKGHCENSLLNSKVMIDELEKIL